jgi:hypothetical protein
MNPLSLLTKGRTIRGLKERPGHYKLSGKSAVPNFSEPKPELFKEEGRSKKDEGRESMQPAPSEQQTPKAERPAPAGLDGAVAGEAPKQGRWSGLAKRLAGWARSWLPWGKERPFQSAAVQTELALDKVKVVRNDLSQDDLEVVAIDKKAAKKTGKPAPDEGLEREKLTANP